MMPQLRKLIPLKLVFTISIIGLLTAQLRSQSNNDLPWQGEYYGYLGAPASALWNKFTPEFRIKVMRTGEMTHLGVLMRWDSPKGDSGTHSDGSPPWPSRFQIFHPNSNDSGPGKLITSHDHTFRSHDELGSDKRGGFYMIPLPKGFKVRHGDSLWVKHIPLKSSNRVSVNFGARTLGRGNIPSAEADTWGRYFKDKPWLKNSSRPLMPVWKEYYTDGIVAGQKYWGNSARNRIQITGANRYKQSWTQDVDFETKGKIELWLWKEKYTQPSGNLTASLQDDNGRTIRTWTVRPSDVDGVVQNSSGNSDDVIVNANETGTFTLKKGTRYHFIVKGPSSGNGYWTCPMSNWKIMREKAYAGDVPGGFPNSSLSRSSNHGKSWDAKLYYHNSVFPLKFIGSDSGVPISQESSDIGDVEETGDVEYIENDEPAQADDYSGEYSSIGPTANSGSVKVDANTYTLRGSGDGIRNKKDEFQFLHQMATGDCQIVARVTDLKSVSNDSQAGIMIRERMTDSSKTVSLTITPKGAKFQRRWRSGSKISTYLSTPVSVGDSLRLTRKGNTFTAEYSKDGNKWKKIGSSKISMSKTSNIGLVVSSAKDGKVAEASIRNVNTKL